MNSSVFASMRIVLVIILPILTMRLFAEERKLRLGTTTSFQVLQVQEDLTLAQMKFFLAEKQKKKLSE